MKTIYICTIVFGMLPILLYGQVGINTDSSIPDPSAGLDVKFSNKGLLPPRVALTALNVGSPVVTPATGLLVYNTATAGQAPNNVVPGYYYWDGTKWTSLGIPAGISGQTLRNEGGNWIANSNLYNDGANVGVGTTLSPTHKLTVEGPTQTVRLIGPGVYGSTAKLNFGDADYVYLSEDMDDHLLIYGSTRTAIMGGNVGIGTITPGQKLTVAGIIETTSGGVKFPDGTTQITAAAASIHTIGESFGGGIVFYVYDGGLHGLIAATSDQSTGIAWLPLSGNYTSNASRDGVYAGQYNTERIIIKQGYDDCAAQICANYMGGNYGDWYLPSKYELNLLYLQKAVVGGFALSDYWSSTEWGSFDSWIQSFSSGAQNYFSVWGTFYVRAVRAF